MKATSRKLGKSVGYSILAVALAAISALMPVTQALAQTETALPQQTASRTPAQNDNDDVNKARVLQLAVGSFIEVKLVDGRKLRGSLGELSDDGFLLRAIVKNRLTKQKVLYVEVRSVKPVNDPGQPGDSLDKNLNRGRLIMGLALGGTALGILIYALAANADRGSSTGSFTPIQPHP